MRRGKRRLGGGGCGYLLMACLIACGLLIVNAIVVRALYTWYAPLAPNFVQHPRFGRAIVFVGPIVLLVVEWTLIDRMLDFLGPPPDGEDS